MTSRDLPPFVGQQSPKIVLKTAKQLLEQEYSAYRMSSTPDTYKQSDHSARIRAALKTLERHLLHKKSKSGNPVTRGISRVRCVDALQVVLEAANEKEFQPEESYRLVANYRVKKRKIGRCTGNGQRIGRV